MQNIEEKTVSIAKANLFGFLVAFPILALHVMLYYLVNYTENTLPDLKQFIHTTIENKGNLTYTVIFLSIVIIGIVIHELIHGFC